MRVEHSIPVVEQTIKHHLKWQIWCRGLATYLIGDEIGVTNQQFNDEGIVLCMHLNKKYQLEIQSKKFKV